MKRITVLTLLCMMVMGLSACGGNVTDVRVTPYTSEKYTDAEVQDAIDTACDYFKKEFSGCTLTEITYVGDELNQNYYEFAGRCGADEVIVLTSSFDVDSSGGDSSLKANSTYSDWKWILVREDGGSWEHEDHGY